jgi:hypothetical protein
MPKVYYIRIRTPRRASPVKRSTFSNQKATEVGAGEAAAAPPALFSFDSVSHAPVFSLGSSHTGSPAAGASAHDGPHPNAKLGAALADATATDTHNQAVPSALPEFDERFQKVNLRLANLAKVEGWHEPLPKKMAQAVRATKQPPDEPPAEGMRTHVEEMSDASKKQEAEPKAAAHEESFLKLLESSIEKISPKSKSDMEDLEENQTRKDQLRQPIREDVEAQRNASEKELAGAAKHPAPMGRIETETQDVPELPERGAPLQVNAQDALPLPKSEEEVSFDEDKQSADNAIEKTGLTEEELSESNEPSFKQVLTERDKILDACTADTAKFQQDEAEFLKRSGVEAMAEEDKTRAHMRHGSTGKHSAVRDQQSLMARKSEEERERVASGMRLVYVGTKIVVDANLTSLGPMVDKMFISGFNHNFYVLQKNVHDDLEAWEDERHSGLISGTVLWWRDKAWGTSDLKEAIAIYDNAKDTFDVSMKLLFKRIAKYVDDTLAQCTQAIAFGNRKLDELVEDQRDPQLKKFAAETAGRIKGDFRDLQQSVEEQKKDLADNLAARYKNSRVTVDSWISEDKKKHQGWARDLRDMAKEIYEIVVNFKNKLMNVLKRGVAIIMSIIRHPIRFLENLVTSVKQGIHQFKERIGEHMREAALSWLFGEIPASEIHVPKDFSPASIFGLAMELLGFTREHIRARAARIVGEHNVAVFERVMAFLGKYFREGPAALWEELQSILSGLKETIVDSVRDWVLAQVIKRGIIQLALMFNPVGAFIEACIAIYNLIVFFIDHARQIADMLGGIFDSVEDMVDGKIDAAANRIEAAMTRAVTFILGFLTSLVGVPSPSKAIRGIVSALRDKIDAGLDWLLEKFKTLAMKAGAAVKTTAGKAFHLLFPKETFVADEEKHTIEVDQSRKDYPILIHTEEVRIEDLIEKAKNVKGGRELKKAYDKYLSLPVEQVKVKDKEDMYEKKNWDKIQEEGKKKIDEFEKVATIIKEVFPKLHLTAAGQTKTHLMYGPEKTIEVKSGSAGKKEPVVVGGTMMIAHPLAHDNLSKGSGTQDEVPPIMVHSSWPEARQHKYKRGHILSERLGGSGKDTKNITPLTSSANGLHNSRVESDLKDLMEKKGELIHYEVHVNYPNSPRDPMGKAHDVESFFPISLSTKWWELEADGAGYKAKTNKPKSGETIVPNVPPYP